MKEREQIQSHGGADQNGQQSEVEQHCGGVLSQEATNSIGHCHSSDLVVGQCKKRKTNSTGQPTGTGQKSASGAKQSKTGEGGKKIKSTNPWSGSMYRTTEREARFKAGHGLNNGYDGLLEIIRAAIDNPELTGAACAGDWRRWTCRYLED